MPEIRVGRDGTAEHNGQTYTFPLSLAGATVTLPDDGSAPEPAVAEEESSHPNKSASKSDWVDYAVSEHGADRETAESLTKQELIDAYTVGGEV